MAPTRAPIRPAAPPPPPPSNLVNFGSLADYSAGFTLPEGNWALEFIVAMERLSDKQQGRAARLGVYLIAHAMSPDWQFLGGDPQEQFLSMGTKAHMAFAPDPNTGKGIVAIPGGAGGGLAGKTNWNMFLKSLYDSSLPDGVFTNDISTLDGIWVHTKQELEPEDRKTFATGEVELQQGGPRKIPVVTEIAERGKPWEGTGGLPGTDASGRPAISGAPPAPVPFARPAAPTAARPAQTAPVYAAPVLQVPQQSTVDAEAVQEAAISGMTDVLVKAPASGITKLLLRANTYTAVKAKYGEEMAQAVTNMFMGDDNALNTLLGGLGYGLQGAMIRQVG